MKIAFYTDEKRLLKTAKACYGSCRKQGILLKVDWEITNYLNQIKYAAFFNGQSCILDIRDIFFLESYYRKTSVVMTKGKIRIRARLDEEEKKLPDDQFVRINRHNIINMQYVRNVKGVKVEMQNGDVLYVNNGRKKEFNRRYREFLEENNILL